MARRVTAARNDGPAAPAAAAASTTRGRARLKIALALLFVGGLALYFALDGPSYVSLPAIKARRDALLAFTAEHYVASLLLAFAVYATAVALSIPGAVVLTLTAGFLFGRWVGTGLVLAAATLGATLVFVAARYLVADWARRRLGALGARINAGFTANAFSYLMFLRLVPLFPFFLVNLAPALTTIPTRTYVLATAIGIVPGTFVFANLGAELGRIDSVQGLLSPATLGALALLGLFALVPVLWRRRRASGSAGNA
jgi:uncharacterized membrane protein YdjX (TVP38/TMEM64 family)